MTDTAAKAAVGDIVKATGDTAPVIRDVPSPYTNDFSSYEMQQLYMRAVAREATGLATLGVEGRGVAVRYSDAVLSGMQSWGSERLRESLGKINDLPTRLVQRMPCTVNAFEYYLRRARLAESEDFCAQMEQFAPKGAIWPPYPMWIPVRLWGTESLVHAPTHHFEVQGEVLEFQLVGWFPGSAGSYGRRPSPFIYHPIENGEFDENCPLHKLDEMYVPAKAGESPYASRYEQGVYLASGRAVRSVTTLLTWRSVIPAVRETLQSWAVDPTA